LNLLGGGISGSPIKVLKNSVLRWRIANEDDNVHILSVQFVGVAEIWYSISLLSEVSYDYFYNAMFFYYSYREEESERKRKRLEDELNAKKRLLNLDRGLSRLSANKSNIVTIARITIDDENIW
jgi:hypothetical protein